MKTKTILEPEFQAIPTEYRGVQLKSRMEAQCAVLFDKLGWKDWRYEPFSITMPSGISYIPDFWLPEQNVLVECRGYETDRSTKQLDEFISLVENSSLQGGYKACGEYFNRFVVIGPIRSSTFTCLSRSSITPEAPFSLREDYCTSLCVLVKCGCGWSVKFHAGEWCPNCEKLPSRLSIISAKRGKVYFNEVLVEDL